MSFFSIYAAQTGAEKFESEVKEVTVYRKGAELTQESKVNLQSGDNTIVITGISPYIDVNSIRLTTDADGLINSVRHEVNYLEVKESEKAIQLKDSLENVLDQLQLLTMEKQILTDEEAILKENLDLEGNAAIPTAAQTSNYIDYFRSLMLKNAKRKVELDNEIAEVNLEINRYMQEISKYQGRTEEHIIEVDFTAGKGGKANFYFSYNISNAGWTPRYDLYVDDKTTRLISKGAIYQSSGLDWEDVSLRLSTTMPSYNSTAPNFMTMYVDFFEFQVRGSRADVEAKRLPVDTSDGIVSLQKSVVLRGSGFNGGKQQTFTQVDNGLDVIYEVPRKYTIMNNEKEKTVTLGSKDVETKLRYISIPRFSEKVYLIADLDKSLSSTLVSGQVNVFYNGGYTGKTTLDLSNPSQDVSVTITADDRVKVKRKLLSNYKEDKFLSSDIEKTFAYELTLENNKNRAIEVELIEMYPISDDEDIEIELIESSGAEVDTEKGKLTWKLNLDKISSQQKRFVYTMRYPKDKRINTSFR
ncbi:MAG: DUF4139 domain-containing protein [Candidatus Kapaibacteriales bacterium]